MLKREPIGRVSCSETASKQTAFQSTLAPANVSRVLAGAVRSTSDTVGPVHATFGFPREKV
jgi:hypothetical protein